MPPVSTSAPAPNTWNVNRYCCSTSSLAMEMNCRWAYSLSSLSTCPALSRVSFLSFCKPGSARDIRGVSVCSSDQGTTHQPDSLTIAAPLPHPQCLLLQTREYEYPSYLVWRLRPTLLGDLGEKQACGKACANPHIIKWRVRLASLAMDGESLPVPAQPPVEPGNSQFLHTVS